MCVCGECDGNCDGVCRYESARAGDSKGRKSAGPDGAVGGALGRFTNATLSLSLNYGRIIFLVDRSRSNQGAAIAHSERARLGASVAARGIRR